VFPFWSAWFESVRFGMDVQQVVALRMMRVAAGGAPAADEMQRMVTEKMAALALAQSAAMTALISGQSIDVAATRALAPVRSRVRANRRRLTRS